jgi:hypothetical protein
MDAPADTAANMAVLLFSLGTTWRGLSPLGLRLQAQRLFVCQRYVALTKYWP